MKGRHSGLQFSELGRIEGALLDARLRAARASITHAGEKGRALEHEARALLRSFLPAEYGLSTGFVAYHGPTGPAMSKQLDIIIFDAIRGGPLVSLQTCDVFPIESVYGYVEVKATLTSGGKGDSSLEHCLRDNAQLRKMRERHFRSVGGGSPVQTEELRLPWLSIRAYIIAFEASKSLHPAKKLGQQLANAAKRVKEGHLHGVYAGGSGFAAMRAINPKTAAPKDWYHAFATGDHSILAFKTGMLRGLASFPRAPANYTPTLESYFDFEPSLARYAPESAEDDDMRAAILDSVS